VAALLSDASGIPENLSGKADFASSMLARAPSVRCSLQPRYTCFTRVPEAGVQPYAVMQK
jgi:hypothetical protein